MLYQNRIKLARMLRRCGLYVRMHAYEYLLGFRSCIIGVLLIEPWNEIAYVYLNETFNVPVKDIVATLSSLLKSIDPYINISIRRRSQC